MAFRKKIITVPAGCVQKIAKANNCHKSLVYNALNYSSNSKKALIIRKQALELYGGVNDTKVIFDLEINKKTNLS